MTTESTTLELLSPWSLAATMGVPRAQREPLKTTLWLVLEALEASSEQAMQCLSLAVERLPAIESQPLTLQSTRTKLSVDEVDDYDRYFNLQHISTDDPGVAMVRSLLTMLQRYLALAQLLAADPDTEAQLELQKEGLRQHTLLLSRVLQLDSVDPE